MPKWRILEWPSLLLCSWNWDTQAPTLKDSNLEWESMRQNPSKFGNAPGAGSQEVWQISIDFLCCLATRPKWLQWLRTDVLLRNV